MSSKYQPPEFAHGRRSATVARVQGLRRSAAAGAHDPRQRRLRTRGDARRSAVHASQRER